MRLALAVLLAAGAVTSAVLALDTGRVASTLAADDTTYGLAPDRPRWDTDAVLPLDLAERLLGVTDQLMYRRALQRLAALRARESLVGGPQFAALIAQAQRALVEVSQSDPDPQRRSEATNVLGVFAVRSPAGSSSGFNPEVGFSALRSFRAAVQLNPANEQAKRNLEIVLRGLRRQLVPLERTGEGGEASEEGQAGIGRTGRGY
jgi:hypothetical protein